MSITRKIQDVVTYASSFVELIPLSGVAGNAGQPALTIANDTLSAILKEGFPWKFNRKVMSLFVPAMNRQDHKFAGATAFTLSSSGNLGGVGIALKTANGITTTGFPGTVTVNTLDPHNFNVGDTVYMYGNVDAIYNSTFTQTPSLSSWSNGFVITAVPSTTSFQFAAISGQTITSGAPGITDFGWIENATMTNQSETSSPQKIWYLVGARELQPSSFVNIPKKVSVINDDQAGTLTIRLLDLPGAAPWGVSIVYQGKPPQKADTTLNDTWSPIPDDYAYVVNQMFLAQAYDFFDSPKAATELQKAELIMNKAMKGSDTESAEEYIVPQEPIMGWDYVF